MSYVRNISDISYDHSSSNFNIRTNDLIVDGTLTADNVIIDNLSVDDLNVDNLTVNVAASTPLLTVGTSMTTPLITAATITNTTSLSSPLVRADTLNNRTGTGNISIARPLAFPNTGGDASSLAFYLNDTGNLTITGAYSSSPGYRVFRIGGFVSLNIAGAVGGPAAVANSPIIISTIPASYRPTNNIIGATPVAVGAGAGTIVMARYVISTSGIVTIYADLLGANFVIGQNVGLVGGGVAGVINFSYVRQP